MNQNEVKCHFWGTMVFKAKKTSVPVLIPGLFDQSRSRTVDTLHLSMAPKAIPVRVKYTHIP